MHFGRNEFSNPARRSPSFILDTKTGDSDSPSDSPSQLKLVRSLNRINPCHKRKFLICTSWFSAWGLRAGLIPTQLQKREQKQNPNFQTWRIKEPRNARKKMPAGRHIRNLLRLIIASNVIYLVIRIGLFYSSFTWKHWMGLILTTLAYVNPYQQLVAMAKPSYTEGGELLDGGFDMSTGGICGYLHDVIYITSFVQLGSIISEKFWFLYLVIPGFAAYQLFGLIKGFMSHGPEGDEEDEKSRKKREKMEKRASRVKFVKTRT